MRQVPVIGNIKNTSNRLWKKWSLSVCLVPHGNASDIIFLILLCRRRKRFRAGPNIHLSSIFSITEFGDGIINNHTTTIELCMMSCGGGG